ncbi:MAG: ATP--guanido phosphotransferase [Clostridiales bacterium]|nr:ATP--guanido phosphotransferase [Clostridiales bacterium]
MAILSPDSYRGNVVTSRIRLARNVEGFPFKIRDERLARELVKKVNRALVKCDTFNLYYMSNLKPLELEAMKERNIISPSLIENRACGSALVNQDESVSVMVCEEDAIREQCFVKGFHLTDAYKRIDRIDDELSKNIDIAFDKDFGYLTACPTNVGTGMRASVMMFLPALSESGKLNELIDEVEKLGLTVRGVYGEGSDAEGYMYQISNQITLGYSEYDIINAVESTVVSICEAEREESARLYKGKNQIRTLDRASKAYGILTNAVLLTYEEFLRHVSSIKLGAVAGYLETESIESIDDLIFRMRPANLCYEYGKALSATDRSLYRAKVVGQKIKKLVKGV